MPAPDDAPFQSCDVPRWLRRLMLLAVPAGLTAPLWALALVGWAG